MSGVAWEFNPAMVQTFKLHKLLTSECKGGVVEAVSILQT